MILRHFGRESDRAYVLTGAVGLASGAVTGHHWWLGRPERA